MCNLQCSGVCAHFHVSDCTAHVFIWKVNQECGPLKNESDRLRWTGVQLWTRYMKNGKCMQINNRLYIVYNLCTCCICMNKAVPLMDSYQWLEHIVLVDQVGHWKRPQDYCEVVLPCFCSYWESENPMHVPFLCYYTEVSSSTWYLVIERCKMVPRGKAHVGGEHMEQRKNNILGHF